MKTYKIYIGGKFPRTESGRYYTPESDGKKLGNICWCSRKDLRNAVSAAHKAQSSWSSRTAFNRSQILYRIAEMLEDRSAQFIDELITMGSDAKDAKKEVELTIDRLVYYAGWCDKFQQVFSSVNPVASSFFNFSVPEHMGTIGIIAPEASALLGLVSVVAPIIAGGNTTVVLASETKPLCAVSFAEVLNSSDVPGGVVNILTGKESELTPHFSMHMGIHGILYTRQESDLPEMEKTAAENMKRVRIESVIDWTKIETQNPDRIMDFQEIKTTWHPIMPSGSGSAAY